MEYRKYDRKYLIRLDPEDEILACMEQLCRKENIRLGTFSGLGACSQLELGVYDVETREFHGSTYKGAWEVTSLFGTVSEKDGQVYLHVHLAASTKNGVSVGGHLKKGVISGTAEILLEVLDGVCERKQNPETGLWDLTFVK